MDSPGIGGAGQQQHAAVPVEPPDANEGVGIQQQTGVIQQLEDIEENVRGPRIPADQLELELNVVLGRGSFGEVYRAKWRTTQEHVACKQLHNFRLTDPEKVREFEREVEVLMSVRHPNVLHFWGVTRFQDNSTLGIVTELCERGSLYRAMESRDMELHSWGRRLNIALQVAAAMRHLHDPNTGEVILHCDLKSPNVLLTSEWKAKIADFGLSTLVNSQTARSNTFSFGNPRWTAPEVLTGETICTPASDVWSFGMVMLELLTLQIPYHWVLATLPIRNEVVAGRPPNVPPPEELPDGPDLPELERYIQLIKQCWALQADERPNFAAIHTELEGIAAQVQLVKFFTIMVPVYLSREQRVSLRQMVQQFCHEAQVNMAMGSTLIRIRLPDSVDAQWLLQQLSFALGPEGLERSSALIGNGVWALSPDGPQLVEELGMGQLVLVTHTSQQDGTHEVLRGFNVFGSQPIGMPLVDVANDIPHALELEVQEVVLNGSADEELVATLPLELKGAAMHTLTRFQTPGGHIMHASIQGQCVSQEETLRREATKAQLLRVVTCQMYPYLQCLILRDVGLGPDGAAALARAAWPLLHTLDVSFNDIRDEGAMAVAQATLPALLVVQLRGNGISAIGAASIAQAQWPKLQTLDLAINCIGDKGAAALTKAAWLTIEVINLSNNGIGDTGATSLLQAPWQKNIRVFQLCNNDISINSSSRLVVDADVEPRLHDARVNQKALLDAAAQGDMSTVQLLLRIGVQLDAVNEAGQAALQQAAALGHSSVVQALLDSGAQVDAMDKDCCTALHSAVAGGHVHIVHMLLKSGAQLNAYDKVGRIALHHAAIEGRTELVETLLRHHINVDGQTGICTADKLGQTALHYAAAGGHAAMVRVLMEHGLKPVSQDKCGWTALHCAAAGGHATTVRELLNDKEASNEKDKRGWTAKDLAEAASHTDVIQVLKHHEHALVTPSPYPPKVGASTNAPEPLGSQDASDVGTASRALSKDRSKEQPVEPPDADEFVGIQQQADLVQQLKVIEGNIGGPRIPIIPADQLQLGDLLGRGCFGDVYRARWQMSQQHVACKHLHNFHLNSQETVREFQQEVKVLMSVRHPNVLLFWGVTLFQDNSTLGIVTELCEKGSLYRAMESRDMELCSWGRRLNIALQVAAAMRYLHAHSYSTGETILHRSLSSPNVLLTKEWVVKIAGKGSVSANPRWTAPEVLTDETNCTTASDVWSFGMVMLELLTLQIPYHKLNNMQAFHQVIMAGRPPNVPPPEELPGGPDLPELERYIQLMEQCWARQADERPHFAAIHTELEGIAAQVQLEKVFTLKVPGNLSREQRQNLQQMALQYCRESQVHTSGDP